MSDKKFQSELQALLNRFPDQAKGGLSVEEGEVQEASPQEEAAPTAGGSRRCVRWMRDPTTGKLICIKWAET